METVGESYWIVINPTPSYPSYSSVFMGMSNLQSGLDIRIKFKKFRHEICFHFSPIAKATYMVALREFLPHHTSSSPYGLNLAPYLSAGCRNVIGSVPSTHS